MIKEEFIQILRKVEFQLYRSKPAEIKPKYRKWKDEEAPVGAQTRPKGIYNRRHTITDVHPTHVRLSTGDEVTFEELLDGYEWSWAGSLTYCGEWHPYLRIKRKMED